MIPMWMFGAAITCGNAFIRSRRARSRRPHAPCRTVQSREHPAGLLRVVNGDEVVTFSTRRFPRSACRPPTSRIMFTGAALMGKRAGHGRRKDHGSSCPTPTSIGRTT